MIPVVPSAGLTLHATHYRVTGTLSFPVLVRVSERSQAVGASSAPLGFVPRLDVRATAYVLPWLGGSVGTALVWRALPPVYTARTGRPVQLTTTPRALFALSSHVLLSVDASLALGGPLAGTASGALATQLTLD